MSLSESDLGVNVVTVQRSSVSESRSGAYRTALIFMFDLILGRLVRKISESLIVDMNLHDWLGAVDLLR